MCFSLRFELSFSLRLLIDVLRLVNCRVSKSSVSAVREVEEEGIVFPDSSGTVGLVEADFVLMDVVEVALVLVLLSVDLVWDVLVLLSVYWVWTVLVLFVDLV
eukprot:sb/3478260/